MVDNKTRKLLLIVVPVVCVLMIALSVYVYNRGDHDTRTVASTESVPETDVSGFPRVTSLDPESVIEGEEFKYFLKIVDSDTALSQIDVQLVEGPSWMSFSQEGLYLYGNPSVIDSDTQKVSLSLNDGTNTVQHNFYILVLPENE